MKASATGLSGELADERCFVNSFPDFEDLSSDEVRELGAHIHRRIDALMPSLFEDLRTKIGPIAEASDSRFNAPDYTLYAGVGGIALDLSAAHGYWKRIEGKAELAEACFSDCHRALACALELVKTDPASSPGFFCGAPGVHALAALI